MEENRETKKIEKQKKRRNKKSRETKKQKKQRNKKNKETKKAEKQTDIIQKGNILYYRKIET